MKISLIVPTYNRPKALKLCLLSLSNQTRLPDEVLVADDGSTSETADLVQTMRKRFKDVFPIRHVWQEDIGFRKPKILNETVRQASGDYLVFLDGDCMAHRRFLQEHADRSAPDLVLAGRRVELGQQLSSRILKKEKVMQRATVLLLWDALLHRARRVREAVQIKNGFIRKLFKRDVITNDGVWGCNFSLSKDLFIDINGCDEDFLDGSLEDMDIGVRAVNRGYRIRSLKNIAIIFHLWHRASWNADNEKFRHNQRILERRIANKETSCVNGIYKR